MSLVSVVLRIAEKDVNKVEKSLKAFPMILDVSSTPPDAVMPGLVVVLETPSASLQDDLKKLANLPGVEELQLVFADYGDDLDQSGHMAVPQTHDLE